MSCQQNNEGSCGNNYGFVIILVLYILLAIIIGNWASSSY